MYCHTRPLQPGVRISLMPAPMLGHTCTSPFGSGLTALDGMTLLDTHMAPGRQSPRIRI